MTVDRPVSAFDLTQPTLGPAHETGDHHLRESPASTLAGEALADLRASVHGSVLP